MLGPLTRPPPTTETVSVNLERLKFAVTLLLPVMERLHVPVPLQAPLHPVKRKPLLGCAVREMLVPFRTGTVQLPEQLTPPPVTRPLVAEMLRLTFPTGNGSMTTVTTMLLPTGTLQV